MSKTLHLVIISEYGESRWAVANYDPEMLPSILLNHLNEILIEETSWEEPNYRHQPSAFDGLLEEIEGEPLAQWVESLNQWLVDITLTYQTLEI